ARTSSGFLFMTARKSGGGVTPARLVRIGPVRDEKSNQFGRSSHPDDLVDDGLVLVSVRAGPCREECPGGVLTLFGNGVAERGGAVVVAGFLVRPGREQAFDDLRVPLMRRQCQGGTSVLVRFVDV